MNVRIGPAEMLKADLADAMTSMVHTNAKQNPPATAVVHCFTAPGAGVITGFRTKAGTGATGGTGAEKSVLDLQIGGVTCLTGTVTLDQAAGVTQKAGTINAAADDIVAGSVITVSNTYTADAPSTQANLEFDIFYKLS